MNAKQQLFAIYKKCYEQRAVLNEAPPLSINIADFSPDTLNYDVARDEVGKIVAYLLSVRSIDKLSIPEALASIKSTYADQPYWKNLLLDYLEFRTAEEKEKITLQAQKAYQRAQEVLNEILSKEAEEKAIIKAFSEPIKEKNFAIDGEKLIRNYLNMSRKDQKKAWETLIQNPGYFSPIITTDKDGNTVLSPEQALEENKKIGSFIKKLSV